MSRNVSNDELNGKSALHIFECLKFVLRSPENFPIISRTVHRLGPLGLFREARGGDLKKGIIEGPE